MSQTGVGFLLQSAHRDVQSNVLHGHTYEVVAWFDGGWDAVKLQQRVESLCAHLDHTELPAELAWGEALAAEVKRLTNAVEVEVRRPLERIYARAR